MRISDWSSDVCSSDLSISESAAADATDVNPHMISGCECDHWAKRARQQDVARPQRFAELRQHPGNPMHRLVGVAEARSARTHRCDGAVEIGRAACRERVCRYV